MLFCVLRRTEATVAYAIRDDVGAFDYFIHGYTYLTVIRLPLRLHHRCHATSTASL